MVHYVSLDLKHLDLIKLLENNLYFIAIGDNLIINFEEVSSIVKEDNTVVLYYNGKPPTRIVPPNGTSIEYIWQQLVDELTGDIYPTNNIH